MWCYAVKNWTYTEANNKVTFWVLQTKYQGRSQLQIYALSVSLGLDTHSDFSIASSDYKLLIKLVVSQTRELVTSSTTIY